jgi:hypothetical protein
VRQILYNPFKRKMLLMLMVFNVLRRWYYCARENNENAIEFSDTNTNNVNLNEINNIKMHDDETIESHQNV